jgi:hypothetical protein
MRTKGSRNKKTLPTMIKKESLSAKIWEGLKNYYKRLKQINGKNK